MYCSTCGSRVVDGRTTCQTCGAVVARMPNPALVAQGGNPAYAPHGTHALAYHEPIGVCPRCSYRGVSAPYFSRGGHVAGLVGLTVLTAGAFGVGGIVYYLVRRNHRICARCGYGWGEHGVRALALAGTAGGNVNLPMSQQDVLPVAESGGKRAFSIVMFVMAAFFVFAGIMSAEFAPLLFAAMFAGGGVLLNRGARLDRERRREAIIQSLQLPVMQLAAKKGGRLTVTDVATSMQWPMARAEKVLNSLEDGMRVMSDITDEGVIVYDFLEIRASQLSSGGGAGSVNALPA